MGGINYFQLMVQSPDGAVNEARLPKEYLQIVAATNFKQRVRKTMEYFHADRLNYAVVGTPNRLEYDQGFFVKHGDGAADVKPIAHLYKTQVYALARHIGCRRTSAPRRRRPTRTRCRRGRTSSTSRCRTSRWTSRCGRSTTDVAPGGTRASDRAHQEPRRSLVYADIESKRRAARYLHATAETVNSSKVLG